MVNQGEKYGKLTVLEVFKKHMKTRNRMYAKCICDCGRIVEVRADNLPNGHTVSCGKCSFNTFEVLCDYAIGYTRKNEMFYIDKEDVEKLSSNTWYLDSNGYVVCHTKEDGIILLHRVVMELDQKDKRVVDHISGDTSDNRKSNLRVVTRSQNNYNREIQYDNTSGTTGVSFLVSKNRWVAQIWVNKEHIKLGYFKDIEDAIKARKDAEMKYFGEYSYDNSRK